MTGTIVEKKDMAYRNEYFSATTEPIVESDIKIDIRL